MSTALPIGQRIREAREARDLTQTELAALVRVSQSSISQIEAGDIHPSYPTLEKICAAMQVAIDFVPLTAKKSRQKK